MLAGLGVYDAVCCGEELREKWVWVSFSVELARSRGRLTGDCTESRSVSVNRTFGETLFSGVRRRCSVVVTGRTCRRCMTDNGRDEPVTRL